MEDNDSIKKKDISIDIISNNPYIWKTKVPLKIRIFLWFLYTWVILTKDNLAKKNWKGNKKCCFYKLDKTIKHLFFDCSFAKFIWCIMGITFGIHTPTSILDMCGHWLNNFSANIKSQVIVAVGAIC
jgi:hypothetical protein